MPNEMQMNPDYQLVMTFLQNITPGDMDEESANQLMAIGQRIMGGGTLTDREREMFKSVVTATDRFPVEQMDTFPQGTNPDIMKQPDMGMGQVTEREGMSGMSGAEMMQPMAPPNPDAPMRKMQKSYQVDGGTEQMTPMDMQQMIDAGIIVPKRPMTRPPAPMTSMRPKTRTMRQEAIMAEVNVENMEDNATLFMSKMGFSHTEAGLDMTDDQLVNFLLLCHQTMMGIGEDEMYEEEEMYEEDDMMEMPHGEDVKVKVMKLDGGNVHEMMNKLLGG